MNHLPDDFELLQSRIDTLEKRVGKLEQKSEMPVEPATPQTFAASSPVIESLTVESASGIFPVLGKALLGVAGAYVLRALADSSVFPQQAVAAIAVVYAIAWLAGAVKATTSRALAGGVYAATSAVILAPMLWELTLRFNLLPPELDAVILGVFIAIATLLTWRHENSPVFAVSYGAAAITAVALQITTHDNLSFIFLLLAMLVLCEMVGRRSHAGAIQPLVAVAADLAVWTLFYIYSSPESTRTDYPALSIVVLLAPACLLFFIAASSLTVKSVLLKKRLTIFEAAQAMIAFLLALISVLYLAPYAAVTVGITCLVLAIACYIALLGRFRNTAEPRNFWIFAIWSAGLLLFGAMESLPRSFAAIVLGLGAVAAIALGARLKCLTLEAHGAIYLTVATITSGLLEYAIGVLTARSAPKPAWGVFAIAACAVLSYAAGRERQDEAWQNQVFHFISAWWATCAVAALLAHGLLGLTGLIVVPLDFHIAFVRTLALCLVTLGLAYLGSRGRRLEMTRIAYTALGFVALKLVVEDLHHGRMAFIAASIFLFAVTLIAVPHLTRSSRTT